MNKNKLSPPTLPFALLAVALSISAFSQTTTAPSPDPKSIPAVDGAIGPCSADFTVTDASASPVYAAKITIHIASRLMNARTLALEVSPNSDGKARFTGLPDRLKHGLYFEASEGDRTAEAFDDPVKTCKAQFTVALRKTP